LARQIQQGAPADIYISANQQWMTFAQEQELMSDNSVQYFLSNELVLVSSTTTEHINPSSNEIKRLIGVEHIAVGDPTHVPIGIYAKDALIHYDLWRQFSQQIIPTRNARTALALLYRSDALSSKKVSIICNFPSSSHRPILYSIGLTTDASVLSHDFFDEILSDEHRSIWESQGFTWTKQSHAL
jgi:molybdate transport system substrate-binding protein